MSELTLATGAVAETRAVAATLARHVRSGDVILLCGDLGAGKTAFTQGLGAALGVDEPIVSPTFTLARHYRGTELTLHHLDVYRFDRMSEVFDVGLPELLDEGGVVVIEWGDVVAAELPPDHLQVDLLLGDADDDRRLELTASGPTWHDRLPSLGEALGEWRC